MSYIGKKPVDFNDVTESQTFTVTGDLTVTSADINGGTLDNVTIGGSTAAAGNFTTGQFNTSLNVDGTVTADELDISTGSGDATIYLQNVESARGMKITKNFNDFSANVFYSLHPNSEAGSLAFRGSQDSTQLFINSNGDISFYEDTGTTPKFFWDASAEALGIGTSSPNSGTRLQVDGGNIRTNNRYLAGSTGVSTPDYSFSADGSMGMYRVPGSLCFATGGTERMRIDSSGNLLVGTTDDSPYNNSAGSSTDNGLVVSGGRLWVARYSGTPLDLNRTSDEGNIINLRKDGTVIGSIGVANTDNLTISGNSSHIGLNFASVALIPMKNGSIVDNQIDLGDDPGGRWRDIYTVGAVSTSDRNEKQQIAELTSAEISAAKRISALFKTFKWNDAVDEKGDNARTHTGVIAQDVRDALIAEALDPAKYAFWCSSTWWESDGETYETQSEAPEGATERNRQSVRYAELMAFVGAATEQRLTHLETLEARIVALENT